MPVCKKCGESFPNRVKINGKTKILNSRKYCLKCSPFGMRNTSKLEQLNGNMGKNDPRECKRCGRIYIFSREKGHRLHICNSCNANMKRNKRKLMAIKYKGGKCIICGYDKCVRALQFHHIKDKDFSISGEMCRSWMNVKKELDKCILVCANCHAEIHDGLINTLNK